MTNVFATIFRGYRWLLERWHIPLTILASSFAWLARLNVETPTEALRDELKAVSQRERIRDVASRDLDLANAIVSSECYETVWALDRWQRQRAENLRADPVRRLRYLRRMSKRLGRHRTKGQSNWPR